jgi:hypothetical protein
MSSLFAVAIEPLVAALAPTSMVVAGVEPGLADAVRTAAPEAEMAAADAQGLAAADLAVLGRRQRCDLPGLLAVAATLEARVPVLVIADPTSRQVRGVLSTCLQQLGDRARDATLPGFDLRFVVPVARLEDHPELTRILWAAESPEGREPALAAAVRHGRRLEEALVREQDARRRLETAVEGLSEEIQRATSAQEERHARELVRVAQRERRRAAN